jgi:hypothetical protein
MDPVLTRLPKLNGCILLNYVIHHSVLLHFRLTERRQRSLLFYCAVSWGPYVSVQCIAVWVMFWGGVVGIATGYRLDSSGIKSLWERNFPHPFPGAHIGPRVKWVTGFFPGSKANGALRWPCTTSSAEVKERVELYLYSPSGSSWPILQCNLLVPSFYSHLKMTLETTSFGLQSLFKCKKQVEYTSNFCC